MGKKPKFKVVHLGGARAIQMNKKVLFFLSQNEDAETALFQVKSLFDMGAKWARKQAVKNQL